MAIRCALVLGFETRTRLKARSFDLGQIRPSTTRSARGCHPCLRNEASPMCPVRTGPRRADAVEKVLDEGHEILPSMMISRSSVLKAERPGQRGPAPEGGHAGADRWINVQKLLEEAIADRLRKRNCPTLNFALRHSARSEKPRAPLGFCRANVTWIARELFSPN